MKYERTSQTRLFKMLDLLKQGVPSADVHKVLYEESVQRGLRSEKMAQEAISKLEIVRDVKKSTNQEDYFLQVDFFVHFRDGLKHTLIGLQVKSSEKALERFMTKIEPGVRIIGVYVREDFAHEAIQKQFLTQLVKLDGEI